MDFWFSTTDEYAVSSSEIKIIFLSLCNIQQLNKQYKKNTNKIHSMYQDTLTSKYKKK